MNEILEIINNDLSTNIVLSMLDKKKEEIVEGIKSEKIRLIRVDALIKSIKQEDDTMLKYDVILKSVERKKVACLRGIIEDYSKQCSLWGELMGYLGTNNAKIVGPSMSVYYDPGYKESDVDIEVMACIGNNIPGTDRIKVKELPAIENVACVVHKGSYEEVSVAYHALLKWIEENEYKVVGPNRELYLEGEHSTNNPEEYITEIQVPVGKIN